MLPKKRIVILTGSEMRHTFFRKAMAIDDGIEVVLSICEGAEKSLASRVNQTILGDDNCMVKNHIIQRERSERDFFGAFVQLVPDFSNPFHISKGSVNDDSIVEKIDKLAPDLIVVYGASIIKGELLKKYGETKKILNLHLGLSPYYRGSGCNFWAMVNNEPECVGATFMYLDEGIDTGEIVYQIRPHIYENDYSPHIIGNRLILESVLKYRNIVKNVESLRGNKSDISSGKLYYRKHFSTQAVSQLYSNFNKGMIKKYLKRKEERDRAFPIFSEEPWLRR